MRRWLAIAAVIALAPLPALFVAQHRTLPAAGRIEIADAPRRSLPAPRPFASPPAAIPSPLTAYPAAVILRAPRLAPASIIAAIERQDRDTGVVCGTVIPAGGRPTRFVYLGAAGMAALDDDGPAFAAMQERVCRR